MGCGSSIEDKSPKGKGRAVGKKADTGNQPHVVTPESGSPQLHREGSFGPNSGVRELVPVLPLLPDDERSRDFPGERSSSFLASGFASTQGSPSGPESVSLFHAPRSQSLAMMQSVNSDSATMQRFLSPTQSTLNAAMLGAKGPQPTDEFIRWQLLAPAMPVAAYDPARREKVRTKAQGAWEFEPLVGKDAGCAYIEELALARRLADEMGRAVWSMLEEEEREHHSSGSSTQVSSNHDSPRYAPKALPLSPAAFA